MDIVKPKLDVVFKRLFVSPDNEDLLRDFISSMLLIPKDDINHLKVTNPEIPPDVANAKFVHLDIAMEVNNTLVNVEMQSAHETYYHNRALYYWAKMFSSTIQAGDDYSEAQKCYMINVMGYNVFECSDYHSEFSAMEINRHERLNDKMAIHFFELPKIENAKGELTKQLLWLKFLNAESKEELNMVNNTTPEINKAIQVIYDFSEDARIREEVRMRERRILDEKSEISYATAKGRAEGEAIGEARGVVIGRIDSMEQMLRKGFDIETVASTFDITVDELKEKLSDRIDFSDDESNKFEP